MNKIIVPPTIETRIVGTTFDNRQVVVALLTQWEQVFLVRENDNPYDGNAVKVQRWDRQVIGYINRDLAKLLASRMDRIGRPIKATVTRLTGEYYPGSSLGALIKFRMPE
jgi:single-stranded-DNA-specific exonuclease